MKKYLMLGVLFTGLSGCASYSGSHFPSYDDEVGGKILYAQVSFKEWVNGKMFQAEPGLLFRKTWNKPAKSNYRWAETETKTGPYHYSGWYVPAFAVICDGVPKLEKDDIVAVRYLKAKYDFDYDHGKAEQVLKLICKHSDKPCLKALKASNKWGATIGLEVPASVVPPDTECRTLIRPQLDSN